MTRPPEGGGVAESIGQAACAAMLEKRVALGGVDPDEGLDQQVALLALPLVVPA